MPRSSRGRSVFRPVTILRKRLLRILLLAATPTLSSAAAFLPLDVPGGQVVALSSDGCTAAGSLLAADAGGFRWRQDNGAQPLGGAVAVHGLSPSGRYVAGAVLDAMQREVASYWDDAGTAHTLPSMPGLESIGVVSQAHAVSDEPRVVGSARRPDRGTVAFEWTGTHGMRALALLQPQASARAVGVAGRDTIGWERSDGSTRAVVWRDGHPNTLRRLGDAAPGEVLGASHTGEVLVGVLNPTVTAPGLPYRWQGRAGLQTLTLPGDASVRLYASSDDGRVLVGGSGHGDRREPWVWLDGDGFLALPALLQRHGIVVPAEWTPLMLTAVSADGARIAGWGKRADHLDSFVIDLDAAPDCSDHTRTANTATTAPPPAPERAAVPVSSRN